MRTCKWIFLTVVSSVLLSCRGTSEEELIGNWQRRAPFPLDGRSFAATFVIGNTGYVCGGYNGFNTRRNELHAFDHTGGAGNGSWSQKSVYPGMARQMAVGFSIAGFGYVGAGAGYDAERGDLIDLADFWRYNPADDTWTEVAPLPVADGARPRRRAIAFSLQEADGNTYGYVGCGSFHDDMNLDMTDFWRFDPNGTTVVTVEGEGEPETKTLSGSWTEVMGYGGEKRSGAVVFVLDNKAYICNGEAPENAWMSDFWVFDPNAEESRKWRSSPDLRLMRNANYDEDYDDDYDGLLRANGVAFVATVDGQQRGHIAGGRNTATCWEYNHNEDLWIQRTTFYNNFSNSTRQGMISFTFPETGRAFIGMGGSGTTHNYDMWEFVPMAEDYTYDDGQ